MDQPSPDGTESGVTLEVVPLSRDEVGPEPVHDGSGPMKILVVVFALVLSLSAAPGGAQAVTPLKSKPPGRSLVLVAKGVPAKTRAAVKVKGPKKYRKTVKFAKSKTLRHLKPGVYRVSPATLKTSKGTYEPTVKPRKAKVTRKAGVRVVIRYQLKPPGRGPGDEDDDQADPTPFPNASTPKSIALVSATSAGTPGNAQSGSPTWSPDGSRIAFSSCATNLAPATVGCWVYFKSLSTGQIERHPSANLGSSCQNSALSPNGERIAFLTSKQLAVSKDTDQAPDVYAVPAGAASPFQWVSSSALGTGAAGYSYPFGATAPKWSPDSARVSFLSSGKALVPGDNDSVPDLFVKTLVDGSILRVARGEEIYDGQWSPDGSRIAFTSGSSYEEGNVFSVDANGVAITQVTNDGNSWGPSWAPPGGDRIAFASDSANLVAGDGNETSDVFVKVLASGAVTRVSVAANGTESKWTSSGGMWSPDGSRIAFLASSGEGFGQQLMVKNLASGAVTQVTTFPGNVDCDEYGDCNPLAAEAFGPVWSPDGTRLAFIANHPNLVSGDTNNTYDVFVATL